MQLIDKFHVLIKVIVFAYIPLFIVLTFLLIVLIIWQYVAFGTQNKPTYNDGDLYKTSNLNVAL